MGLIILVIGILIGLLIERYIFQEKPIGSLRSIIQIRTADHIYFLN